MLTARQLFPIAAVILAASLMLSQTIAPPAALALPNEAVWNGVDKLGRSVPPGIYFYELVTGSHRQVRKLMLAN